MAASLRQQRNTVMSATKSDQEINAMIEEINPTVSVNQLHYVPKANQHRFKLDIDKAKKMTQNT